jgi:hypothetical protein
MCSARPRRALLGSRSLVTVTRYARRVVTQTDLLPRDGRTLHAYDALADGADVRLAVFRHHGTPNLGAPPEPLLPAAAGAAQLRAAARGRAALEDHLASAEFDPDLFTPADHAALAGPWSWLLTVVEQAMAGGLGGMVDDDLAGVAPWRPWAGCGSAPARADPRNGQVVPSDLRVAQRFPGVC